MEGFTERYGLTRLVYYEWHDRIIDAIQREKNIKHWKRAWKVDLIEKMNPEWTDLYETLNREKSAGSSGCLGHGLSAGRRSS